MRRISYTMHTTGSKPNIHILLNEQEKMSLFPIAPVLVVWGPTASHAEPFATADKQSIYTNRVLAS
jgi:hypothetical protein